MKEFLASILGEYVPVSYTVTEAVYDPETGMLISDTVSNVIPSGVAGVDWLYVLSGLAFILCIYCVFKFLGGLICKTF